MTKRALVLIGSPKGLERSNSARYAHVLTAPFEEEGWAIDWVHAHSAVASESRIGELVAALSAARLVVVVAPLYVDSLPAPVLRTFERITDARRRSKEESGVPRLAAVIQCGFVEPRQNETAVAICRAFAAEAGLEWFGSLILGGGGMPRRRITRALRAAGEALATGFPIPPQVRRRANRPVMPRLLYVIGGNLMWRRMAKRNGVSKAELLAAPYER